MQRPAQLSFALLVSVTTLACAGDPPDELAVTPQRAQQPPRTTAGPVPYRGPLPPIPTSPYAAAPPDIVRAVYEFAARRPDVLRYVPCFCGCERNGHQDNEDCFVASRGEDGRPQWDTHGLT